MRKKLLALIVTVVMVCSVVTGCAQKAATTTTPADAAKPSSEIKIGISEPMTGSEASYGKDMANAIQLAVDEINAAGGINGQKIVTVMEDDGCDPQQATAAANKLVSAGVVAMVGGYGSGAILPTLSIFNEKSIPYVIPTANSTKVTAQNPGNGFQINGTAVHQSQKFVELLGKLSVKSIAIINQGDAFSEDLANNAKEAFVAAGGKVVGIEVANKGEQDFSSMITSIMAKKPDAIFWTAYYAEGGLLVKQLRNAGYKGTVICGDGNIDPKFIEIGGVATEGVYVMSAPMLEYLPEGKSFLDAYKAKYNANPGPYGPLAYDSMKLMADAIKRTGSTDGAKIIAELKKTQDFAGISGKITFKPDNTLKDSNFVVIMVKDGKFVLAQ